MAENVENVDSDFDSISSSQKSFLNKCSFANPNGGVAESDSDGTEILGNQISPPVVSTPILSLSSTSSFVNDDEVFRTPRENTSLSSAPDSESRVRVMKLKSPSSKFEITPLSASSPDIPEENVRVLKTKSLSNSVIGAPKAVMEVMPVSSLPSTEAVDLRVRRKRNSKLKSSSCPSASSPFPLEENVRVLERKSLSNSVIGAPKAGMEVVPLTSPLSAVNVRVPVKHSDLKSPSPTEIRRTRVLENQPIADSVCNTKAPKSSSRVREKHSELDSPSPNEIGRIRVLEHQPISDFVSNTKAPKSSSPARVSKKHLNLGSSTKEISETENSGGDDLPFKDIIEALLRNSGEKNLSEREEKFSCVEILKQCGLKFP